MKSYDALVRYYTAGGHNRTRLFGGVQATSTANARAVARRLFEGERALMKQRTRTYVDVRITGIIVNELVPEPAPIQSGEQITIPVTGTVEVESANTILLRGRNGSAIRMTAEQVRRHTGRAIGPVVTTEYWTVYPNGNVYQQDQPLRTSSYDFADLVRLRITKHNGRIVNKEII